MIICSASSTIRRMTSPAGSTESIRPASWPTKSGTLSASPATRAAWSAAKAERARRRRSYSRPAHCSMKRLRSVCDIAPGHTVIDAISGISLSVVSCPSLFTIACLKFGWSGDPVVARKRVPSRTLMVAAGTGNDFRFFPPGQSIIAIDISPKMLERAAKKAAAYNGTIELRQMDVKCYSRTTLLIRSLRSERFDRCLSRFQACASHVACSSWAGRFSCSNMCAVELGRWAWCPI